MPKTLKITRKMSDTQQNAPQQFVSPEEIIRRKNKALEDVKTMLQAKKISTPQGYDPVMALELAVPIILETKDKNKVQILSNPNFDLKSVANALYLMVVNGFYAHEHHCAFIARGTKLHMDTQYQGRILRARRDAGLVKLKTEVIYKNDKFDINIDENGEKSYIHKPAPIFERISTLDNVAGAWAYLFWADGTRTAHEMSVKEIEAAWIKGGNSIKDTHRTFPQKMCTKTVIGSALTIWGSTSPSKSFNFEDYEDTSFEDVTEKQPVQKLQSLPSAEATPIVVKAQHEPEKQPVQTSQPANADNLFEDVPDWA